VVVQPALTADIERAGGYGPKLQAAMFERAELPPLDDVDAFSERARELFARSS
jgi:hypothetical protein